MKWRVEFSHNAEKFLGKNHLDQEEAFKLIRCALDKFRGVNANIDVKKLKGVWSGFYRVRKGDLRMIASFDFDSFLVFVVAMDWRGNVYK
jgi:mRNA interferase RelE/StbE